MKNILTIMKKEFARFFGDRRMMMTILILPGLMIYLVYSLMGNAFSDIASTDADYISSVYVVNMPASVDTLTKTLSQAVEITPVEADEVDSIKSQISAQELDLLMVFPENFDADVAAYNAADSGGTGAPNVEVYYNSVRTESSAIYTTMTAVLDNYETGMANKFDVNSGSTTNEGYDLASDKDNTGMLFSMMLPMLLMTFMFSGCMAVAPESIAGEKERGTIATLLITPMKRSHLAIGKILSLGCIALLSGLSSALGTILAIPKMMSGSMGDAGLNASVYGAQDYLLLVLIILSTVLLLISVISIISAYAKTIKEAGTMVSPLMVLTLLIGVSAMFGGGAKTQIYFYLIPLYNSVQAMVGIFTFSATATAIIITVASNLVYAGIFAFILTRMFNSERIVFSKA